MDAIYLSASGYTDNSNRPVAMLCPKCVGASVWCDTSMVLTSMPPQYSLRCRNCGWAGSGFCHDVKFSDGPRTVDEHLLTLTTSVSALQAQVNEIVKRLDTLAASMAQGEWRA